MGGADLSAVLNTKENLFNSTQDKYMRENVQLNVKNVYKSLFVKIASTKVADKIENNLKQADINALRKIEYCAQY
jgi:hypothetical protein